MVVGAKLSRQPEPYEDTQKHGFWQSKVSVRAASVRKWSKHVLAELNENRSCRFKSRHNARNNLTLGPSHRELKISLPNGGDADKNRVASLSHCLLQTYRRVVPWNLWG